MEYIYKEYDLETSKNLTEKRIVTLSDLHFNQDITKDELDDLILKINDLLPNYLFILGDVFTFNNLENKIFRENILHFFKLLSSVTKTYLILGNSDYLYDSKIRDFYLNINCLLDFYQNTNINLINNSLVKDDDMNIIGFNKLPDTYQYELKDTTNLKIQIEKLLREIQEELGKDKYTIFLTHSHLDLLKLKIELLQNLDLILAGHTHGGLIPTKLEKLFPKNKGLLTSKKLFQENVRGCINNNNQTIIVNGGITKISDSNTIIKKLTKPFFKGEIDLITINQVKK